MHVKVNAPINFVPNSKLEQLINFYNTPLGICTKDCICVRLSFLWHQAVDDSIIGLGYPQPFFSPAQLKIAMMPDQMGAYQWPRRDKIRSCLVNENLLPIADHSVKRVFVIHALEYSTQPQKLLQEIARILMSNGEIITIVPRIASSWRLGNNTPFGSGQAWSEIAMHNLLRQNGFTPYEKNGRQEQYRQSYIERFCPQQASSLAHYNPKSIANGCEGLVFTRAIKRSAPVFAPLCKKPEQKAPAARFASA